MDQSTKSVCCSASGQTDLEGTGLNSSKAISSFIIIESTFCVHLPGNTPQNSEHRLLPHSLCQIPLVSSNSQQCLSLIQRFQETPSVLQLGRPLQLHPESRAFAACGAAWGLMLHMQMGSVEYQWDEGGRVHWNIHNMESKEYVCI